MKQFFLVLNWIVAVFFILFAVGTMFSSFLASIPLLLISLLFIPQARDFAHAKTGKTLRPLHKAGITFALFLSAGFIYGSAMEAQKKEIAAQKVKDEAEALAKLKAKNIEYFKNNKIEILAKINDLINKGEYNSAATLVHKYDVANDAELNNLNKVIRNGQLVKELKGVKKSNLSHNQAIYQELASLNPTNKTYKTKLEYYNKKIAAKAKAERLAKERKKKIEAQFSAWDGSHIALERLIKKNMNDPGSYDHVETTYWDQKTHLIVMTKYRGKNAFGGVVLDYIKAKVTLDGVVVKTFK